MEAIVLFMTVDLFCAMPSTPVDRAKAEIDASDELTLLERQEVAGHVTQEWENIEWERKSMLVNESRVDRLRLVSEYQTYQMILDEHFKYLDPNERLAGIEVLHELIDCAHLT